MRKILLPLSILAMIVACQVSNAQPQMTRYKSVDDFLKHVDLKKLVETDYALNLTAQMADSTASTNNVEDFTDFVALSTTYPEEDPTQIVTFMTQFNKEETILTKAAYFMPWMGVARFKQSEIPTTTLQQGLNFMRTCMDRVNDPMPSAVSHVTIYKTIRFEEMVYDYAVKRDDLPSYMCQEVLCIPSRDVCQRGMVVSCHIEIGDAKLKLKKK